MPAPMVRMSGIRKEFPGVLALDDVAFRMFPGEVHALMGENGAGKSTLIKVLTGVYGVDAGTIELDGEPVAFSGPGEAQQAGVSTVYQEVNLCPNLSVAENVCLGREPRRLGRIQWGPMRRRAEELLARLDVHVDVSAELSTCSIAVQQLVAIARALDVEARVLVLDEPTSSLDTGEVERLLQVVRSLREQGLAILFVSHFIDQVFAVADRMTVLRNGKLIGEYRTADITPVELVTKMIGKELQVLEDLEDSGPTRAEVAGAPVLLAAEDLGRKGGVAAVQPRHPRRGGRRAGRPARLRAHRAGPAALRRRPRRQRVGDDRRQRHAPADPAGRARPPDRVPARRTASPRGSSRN